MTSDAPRRRPPRARTKRGDQITRETRAEMYYAMYAVMGVDRSLRALVEVARRAGVPVSKGSLERYSQDFHWVERAAEFDRERTQIIREDAIQQAIHNDVQHAQLGRLLQRLAIQDVQRRDAQAPADRVPLTGTEVARLADIGVRIERLASGQATEITEIYTAGWQVIIVQLGEVFTEALENLLRAVEEHYGSDAGLRERFRMAAISVFAPGADRILDQHFRALGIGNVQVGAPAAPDHMPDAL